MATTVKMCDMSDVISAKVFVMLNHGNVKYVNMDEAFEKYGMIDSVLVTNVEPNRLVYPEGWYYAKGSYRNKHQSTTGLYSEIIMIKPNGDLWEETAKYCTLEV